MYHEMLFVYAEQPAPGGAWPVTAASPLPAGWMSPWPTMH